jgi:hypothetical protein
MEVKQNTATNNGKAGNEYKTYRRILYWCEQDDVWVSVETPLTK